MANTLLLSATAGLEELAGALAAAARASSVRAAAELAGVDYSAVYAALRGETWLDTRSLALLERVLGPLWPHA